MANEKLSAIATRVRNFNDANDRFYLYDDSGTQSAYGTFDDLFGGNTAINWQVVMGSNGAKIEDGALTIEGSATTGTTASANADDLVIDGTGARGISILSTTFSGLYAGDAASATVGSFVYDHGNNRWGITAAGTEKVRVSGNGLILHDGSSFGDPLDTHNDTADWTPTLEFGGSSTGITYGTRVGKVYKLGNMRFIYARMVLTSKGSQTGDATISGLSDTATADGGVLAPLSWGATDNIVITDHSAAHIANGATEITLTNTASGASKQTMDDTDFENTSELTLSGWYYVD